MNINLRDLIYSVLPTTYLEVNWNKDSNLLITAPHGGGMKPISFPDRKYGVRLMDTYTRRITHTLLDNYPLNNRPSYIISDIHRSKIDFNRNIEEGAQGNEKARELWEVWNRDLEVFTKAMPRPALYIDIHSHNDSDKFELGYNINAKNYRYLFFNHELSGFTLEKPISSLFGLDYNLYEMIFGKFSIKNSLEKFGYNILFPDGNEVYFNGGRNVEVFNGPGVGAIQIEIPVSQVKKDFNKVCDALLVSIETFRKNLVK